MGKGSYEMEEKVLLSIRRQVEKEPYAGKLGLRLVDVAPGHAVVEMTPADETMNIFGMIHGGAIFSLIDEAFQVSCNAHGTVAVALNMTITYHQAPVLGRILRAESNEVHRSRKTGTYEIKVTDEKRDLIATCLALAYRKEQRLPFLDED